MNTNIIETIETNNTSYNVLAKPSDKLMLCVETENPDTKVYFFENKPYKVPVDDSELTHKWLVDLPESLRDYIVNTNKRAFILWKYKTTFNSSPVKNFKDMVTLIANKTKVKSWKDDLDQEWKRLHDIPKWLVESETLKDYWLLNYQNEVLEYNKMRSQFLDSEKAKRDTLAKEIKELQADLETKKDLMCKDHPTLYIHLLDASYLSESDILAIEGVDDRSEKNALKSEKVTNMKINLLTKVKNSTEPVTLELVKKFINDL